MKTIILHEVGMRDGLQMEPQVVPTAVKVAWIEGLADSGVDIVQAGSFVHPVKVPQMADTDRLFAEVTKRPGSNTVLSALVLNEKGLERALAAGAAMICMGVSASETHSMKNTGMGTAEAARRIIAMARQAESAGKRVQVSVQSAFGCGFEGPVPEERVLGIARQYLDAGLKSISLADTAGHANPRQVERLYGALFGLDASVGAACHFHNTYGLGVANVFAAIAAGVRSVESSIAGLGGCPFTKLAAGNVCTEDLVHALQRMGLRPDIDLAKLVGLAREFAAHLGRPLPGLVYRTGGITAATAAGATGETRPVNQERER
jgi:hydroxymethylglutaryl-CoA lyase